MKINHMDLFIKICRGLKFLHEKAEGIYYEQCYFHLSRVYKTETGEFKILPPYLDFINNENY